MTIAPAPSPLRSWRPACAWRRGRRPRRAQPARDRYEAARALEATARARIAQAPDERRRRRGRRRSPRRQRAIASLRDASSRRYPDAAATATTRSSRPRISPARSTPPTDARAHRELVAKYVDLAGARVPVELAAHRGPGGAAQRRGRRAWPRLARPPRRRPPRRSQSPAAAPARPARRARREAAGASGSPRRARRAAAAIRSPRPSRRSSGPSFPTSCGSRCRSTAR